MCRAYIAERQSALRFTLFRAARDVDITNNIDLIEEQTMKRKQPSTLTLALGSAFATALAATPLANAGDNPFSAQSIGNGYMVAAMEGKCGGMKAKEGKCGGMKAKEGKCGEGKCGEGKCGVSVMDANKDGKVSKGEFLMHHEAVFANMDANKDGMVDDTEMGMGKAMEGKCGGAKAKEGKCGGMKGREGKCGGMK